MKQSLAHLSLRILLCLAPVILIFPSPSPACAQMQISPQAALERLFTQPQLEAGWFTPTLLNQVSLQQVQQVIASLQENLGPYQQVQPAGADYFVIFEQGRAVAQITLNNQGQIAGLLFQPAPEAISLEAAVEQLQSFPGQANFLVLADQSERIAFNADQPLAVGSAFKLAVLAALRQQIESGQRHWADVVELRPEWKSLPSGFLQTWPAGTHLTLETLATLMISVSDNTATDTLIHILGRAPIEAFAPRNQPLLTTREFFALKDPQNSTLLARYRNADSDEEKRQVLADIADAPLSDLEAAARSGEGILSGQPTALDVEYFFTPRELCALMDRVADLPLMSVNPAPTVVNAANWERVAFKGGSEPGVLQMTHQLRAKNGTTYCVSMTWNNADEPLDENRLFMLYGAVIEGLVENE